MHKNFLDLLTLIDTEIFNENIFKGLDLFISRGENYTKNFIEFYQFTSLHS